MNKHGVIIIPSCESLQSGIKIDRTIKNRCPQCGTPFCVGKLAPGTAVEVECKRSKCKGLFMVVSV